MSTRYTSTFAERTAGRISRLSDSLFVSQGEEGMTVRLMERETYYRYQATGKRLGYTDSSLKGNRVAINLGPKTWKAGLCPSHPLVSSRFPVS